MAKSIGDRDPSEQQTESSDTTSANSLSLHLDFLETLAAMNKMLDSMKYSMADDTFCTTKGNAETTWPRGEVLQSTEIHPREPVAKANNPTLAASHTPDVNMVPMSKKSMQSLRNENPGNIEEVSSSTKIMTLQKGTLSCFALEPIGDHKRVSEPVSRGMESYLSDTTVHFSDRLANIGSAFYKLTDERVISEPIIIVKESPEAENGDYLQRLTELTTHPYFRDKFWPLIDSIARMGFSGEANGIRCTECGKRLAFQYIEQTDSKHIVWHEEHCVFHGYRRPCAHCVSCVTDSRDSEMCLRCGQRPMMMKGFTDLQEAPTYFRERTQPNERAFVQLQCAFCRRVISDEVAQDICCVCSRFICRRCVREERDHNHCRDNRRELMMVE